MAELRKQISIFLPVSVWRELRAEAARQRIPITELCRRWMRPQMERLLNSRSENWSGGAGHDAGRSGRGGEPGA